MYCTAMRGTLIAAAPTRDGLILAADSRSTLGKRFCDDTYKLVEVEHSHPTALAVAGIGIVFPKPPVDVGDICAWVKTAPRVMDVEAFAKTYIEARANAELSEASLIQLGTASLDEVRKLTTHSPDAPSAYAGNNLYTVVVGSYDASTKHARLGVIGVRFNPNTRVPETTDHAFWDFHPDSKGQAFHFGLFDYVSDHVFREGRSFLNEYPAFKPDRRSVREISRHKAIAALSNLLEAAAKTTEIVAPPGGSGIGGPTDILLLGKDPSPRRIRWK